jgi:cyclophilin family peptidyl-prolyl cis-trans isomerase/HEAT repeat protein
MIPDQRVLARRFATLLLIGASAGCATSYTPPADPVAEPWGAGEIEVAADLLSLEDRRVFDGATINAASAAPEANVRLRASLAAGRIGAPGSRSLVRMLLQDEDTAVAATAAFMAGQLSDTAAVDLLAGLLETASSAPSVAAEAAGALGRIGTDRGRQRLRSFLLTVDSTDLSLLPAVSEALIAGWRAGEPSVEPFARWITNPAGEIRWRAVYALTRRARPEAARFVRPLLSDPDPVVRAMALRGLSAPMVASAALPRSEVLAEIVSALDDESYQVRIEAIRMLASYGDTASVAAIEARLDSGTPHEVLEAVNALGRIGPGAARTVPALTALLADPATRPHVRETVVGALATVEPPTFSSVIDDLTEDAEWRVRAALATAIAPRRSEALPTLRRLTRDPDPRVSSRTIAAMVEAFDPPTMQLIRPLLLEMLFAPDVHVRTGALQGLSVISDPSTFPALLDAYDRAQSDIESVAALAAIDAIAALGVRGALRPERAFFARFSRPNDHQVRLRAIERFGDAARDAWGDPLPVETGNTPLRYRELIAAWLAPPSGGKHLPRLSIDTGGGSIELELFGDVAPLTVANILDLARVGYFDDQVWSRVVANFVVQGGDPRGDTSGGPGYTIRDELNRHRFGTGTLGMALSGPDTGGSQFFITHSPQPHLDGAYTVFGRVVSGQNIVETILPGDRIRTVRVIEEG